MKNWLVILLVAAVVIAGAFLPELLLNLSAPPELNMDYQEPSVSSESSSDYSWRMDTLAEFYFGEGVDLLNTYISQTSASDGDNEAFQQFEAEFEKLVQAGAVPEEAGALLAGATDYRIRYYYMFDSPEISGFRFAELTAAASNWRIFLCMDMESGKLARVDYGGSLLFPGGQVSPQTSWYDVLRAFGDYLGMSDNQLPVPSDQNASEGARKYYDDNTADLRRGELQSGDGAWLEVRALKENYAATITVYHGGK